MPLVEAEACRVFVGVVILLSHATLPYPDRRALPDAGRRKRALGGWRGRCWEMGQPGMVNGQRALLSSVSFVNS